MNTHSPESRWSTEKCTKWMPFGWANGWMNAVKCKLETAREHEEICTDETTRFAEIESDARCADRLADKLFHHIQMCSAARSPISTIKSCTDDYAYGSKLQLIASRMILNTAKTRSWLLDVRVRATDALCLLTDFVRLETQWFIINLMAFDANVLINMKFYRVCHERCDANGDGRHEFHGTFNFWWVVRAVSSLGI